ncbi:hypothetical protein QYM36_010452 [Artemia franciscana]|uniref:Reverse transcriptase domain-containing protein n=1 Tax=Artemia franciscana TaxID=6661 RepID=A0AA88HQ43_ARTSF|nr:hypothetical protein QYM36_010452 [Artemia franciscana]
MFGRFKWRRYPFGIISAQDEYQCWMEEAFEGLGLGLIVDDIAGIETSKEDHDMQLKAILQRAREKGVKFIQDKCVFNATAIPYFGHLLTMEGVKPDPNKTKAISEMLEPRNKEELQMLLGMFNYLSRYIPNLSRVLELQKQTGKKRTGILLKGDQIIIPGCMLQEIMDAFHAEIHPRKYPRIPSFTRVSEHSHRQFSITSATVDESPVKISYAISRA